jgi:hypothetical protein
MYAQCQAEANQRAVPAGNDAYSRICQPMVNRIVGKVVFVAMAQLKQRMEGAAAAGCPNAGTPQSVHCDTWAAHAACEQALPAHASTCALDFAKAKADLVGQVWAQVDTADAPCTATGDQHARLACAHPLQQAHCRQALKMLDDSWGAQAVAGIACDRRVDPAYEQMKDATLQIVAAMNTSFDGSEQTLGCLVRRDDPLVVTCDNDYRWDAQPARVDAVYAQINAGNTGRPRPTFCPPDSDNDGAETPCIEGEPLPDLPPAVDVAHPLTPVRAAPVRLRPRPVIQGG